MASDNDINSKLDDALQLALNGNDLEIFMSLMLSTFQGNVLIAWLSETSSELLLHVLKTAISCQERRYSIQQEGFTNTQTIDGIGSSYLRGKDKGLREFQCTNHTAPPWHNRRRK